MRTESLDPGDAVVIDNLQGGFPICDRPFQAAGRSMNMHEDELIERVGRLLGDGTLTRFGPMFDAERMGGAVSLCAMAVPVDRFDAVAERVNAQREVAHNYQREHELNMWFVVATGEPDGIEPVIERIRALTGLDVFNLPKLEEFYIGLRLHTGAGGGGRRAGTQPGRASGPRTASCAPVSSLERDLARASQAGLALDPMPYHRLARDVGVSHTQVQESLGRMLDLGRIRRIGVVPNHYRLGYRANGMSVWDVSDERVSHHGQRIGALDAVSHCYRRPRHLPVWPYNLFVMVHGASRDEVGDQVAAIEAELGDDCCGHDLLFSTRILKKTGIRFG